MTTTAITHQNEVKYCLSSLSVLPGYILLCGWIAQWQLTKCLFPVLQ